MKRVAALSGCVLLSLLSAIIWGAPGIFFTGNFSALVLVLSRNAQLI